MNYNKVKKIRDFMNDHGYESCLIGNKENVIWLTDGLDLTIGAESLIPLCNIFFTKDEVYVIATNNEIDQLREVYFDENIKYIDYPWYMNITKTLESVNCEANGCSDYNISNFIFEEELNKIRYILDKSEIDIYKRLGKKAEEILYYICNNINENITEEDLSNKIKSELIKNAIEVPVILIVSDERMKSYRHPKPTRKKIDKIAMIILTIKSKGLYLSLSRVISKSNIDMEYLEAHKVISSINAHLIHITNVSKTIGQVFDELKFIYEKHGLKDEWKKHHQGGLTGYKGREIKAYFNTTDKIKENQAYAWNPTTVGGKSEETIIIGVNENYIVSQSKVWPKVEIIVENKVYQLSDILIIDE